VLVTDARATYTKKAGITLRAILTSTVRLSLKIHVACVIESTFPFPVERVHSYHLFVLSICMTTCTYVEVFVEKTLATITMHV
jgi:hypothetical protein